MVFSFVPKLGPTDNRLAYALAVVGLFSGIIHSLIASLISALFPTAIRQSGFAFPYSIGTAVFTGLTPLAMAWLSGSYGLAAPIGQCLLGAAIALGLAVAVRFLPFYLGPEGRADTDAVGASSTGHS